MSGLLVTFNVPFNVQGKNANAYEYEMSSVFNLAQRCSCDLSSTIAVDLLFDYLLRLSAHARGVFLLSEDVVVALSGYLNAISLADLPLFLLHLVTSVSSSNFGPVSYNQ